MVDSSEPDIISCPNLLESKDDACSAEKRRTAETALNSHVKSTAASKVDVLNF